MVLLHDLAVHRGVFEGFRDVFDAAPAGRLDERRQHLAPVGRVEGQAEGKAPAGGVHEDAVGPDLRVAGLGEGGPGEFRGVAARADRCVGVLAEALAELVEPFVVAAVEAIDDPLEVRGVLETDADVAVVEPRFLRVDVEPVGRARDVVVELDLRQVAQLVGRLLVGAIPEARQADEHEVQLARHQRFVGVVHFADDQVLDGVRVEAVAVEAAFVGPPVRHALQRDGVVAAEAVDGDVVGPGRRLLAVVVALEVIGPEVLEEFARGRAQVAEPFELAWAKARGVDRDRVVVVARDAAELLGVEIGVPIRVRPRGAEEVEGVEEVVGGDRLAVREARLGVELEVGRQAVLRERPAERDAGDGLVGVGVRRQQAEVVVLVEVGPEAVVGVGADAPQGRRRRDDHLAQRAAADGPRVGELLLFGAVLPVEVLGEVARLREVEELRVLPVELGGAGVAECLGPAGGAGVKAEEQGEERFHFWTRLMSKASCRPSPMALIMTMSPTRQESAGTRIHQARQFSRPWWRRSPHEGSVGGRPKPR